LVPNTSVPLQKTLAAGAHRTEGEFVLQEQRVDKGTSRYIEQQLGDEEFPNEGNRNQ
jgi:hypothetical protein